MACNCVYNIAGSAAQMSTSDGLDPAGLETRSAKRRRRGRYRIAGSREEAREADSINEIVEEGDA